MNEEDAEQLIENVLECCYGYLDGGEIGCDVLSRERKGLIEFLMETYEVKKK